MELDEYIEVPLTDAVELESGLIHWAKDLSSPNSPMLFAASATTSGVLVSGGKPPRTEKTKSSRRQMLSRSKQEPSVKKKKPFPLKRLASSAESGLNGLRFLNKNSKEGEGWKAAEKRFEQFAVAGRLLKENFGRLVDASALGSPLKP